MNASNAVPPSAVTRTLGYALDYIDLQTAQANLPVKILVLTDGGTAGQKEPNATTEKVKAEFGSDSLAVEVMEILDRLNASQFIDVLAVDINPPTTADSIEKQIEDGLGDTWYNLIVNPFGQNSALYTALRNVNGEPSESGGDGRWNALKVKPFVAISGTDAPTNIETLNVRDMTNIVATAPNAFKDTNIGTEESPILLKTEQKQARIAASWAFLAFRQFSTKPYLDISGQVLPFVDYPKDLNIGNMADFNRRDVLAKDGICTVTLDVGQGGYVVQDFVTGRRVGTNEMARDWNWVRNLFVDFNFAYQYQILQERTLMDKVIVGDDAIINPSAKRDFIRLKTWKATVANFFERMEAGLFITDAEFSVDSLIVEVSSTNPKRINTQFAYKRTSTVNIASTTAYVGFAFGE